MEKENKKKNNILLFFIKMVIIFIIFEILNSYIYPLISKSIYYGRYVKQLIPELVCAFLALVVIIISKKTYIFTEKKESFINSLLVGGFMLFYSIFLLIYGLSEIHYQTKLFDLISLIILCASIGIFEEFINRGWIQNAFIEKFGNNRRQVFLSIVLSSLIFGGMHISNIWIGGQGIIETLSQIIQATGLGILLGSVYFRTKNIWACVFLHGFWDFSLFIREIDTIKSCTEGTVTNSYLITTLITSIILTAIYILISLYILRKSKINNLAESYTEEEILKSEKQKGKIIYFILILYFGIAFIPIKNNEICYTYENKEINYNEITYPEYNQYTILDKDITIDLSITEDYKFIIKTDNYEIDSKINNISNFMVLNNEYNYTIILLGLNEHGTDTILYYSNFITSDNINNSEEYINNFINSFNKLESAPTIDIIGYIISLEDNNKYPYIQTSKSEKLILFEENLYILNKKDVKNEENTNQTAENNE